MSENLRQKNEQYVGRFFRHSAFNSTYIYIVNITPNGYFDWVMFNDGGYRNGWGEGTNLDSWEEVSQEEFDQQFDASVKLWRVW